MIELMKPYIDNNRLYFDLKIDKETKTVWFEVEKEYEKYLCDDRVDAIVVGLLHYAMVNNHDIKSNSYITEELLYKINNYLLPSLTKYDKKLHNIKIDIKTKEACENAGAVGTGCSCGVDSIHAYLNNKDRKEKQFKLTHLCINNVGAFNETYKDEGIDKVREARYKKSKEFAKKVKLPLIVTNSNFYDEIYQNHSYTHTYSSTFAVLCLQKLWKTYYYGSSGYDYTAFNIVDTSEHDCSCYELLSLDVFSTNNLNIYSEGAAEDRLEKTRLIANSQIAKAFLHVCIKKEDNCGVCPKCMRTLLTLDALNIDLNEYKKVFDIDYYNKNKNDYYEWIHKEHLWSDKSINEATYQLLLKKQEFKKFVEKYNKDNNIGKPIDYKEEYEKVINSKTFKLGDKILKIPRKLKSIIKK